MTKKRCFLRTLMRRLTARKREERLAREIAGRHNMLDDYLAARAQGLSPREALEEWDLLSPEERSLFEAEK